MSEIGDINSLLYFAYKSGKLEKISELLIGMNPLVDTYLSFDMEKIQSEDITYFSTQDIFSIVYKFLKECYPKKAYLFANVIDRGDNIVLKEKRSTTELNKLIYKLLSCYLKKYDINTAIEMLEKELNDLEISKNSYKYILKKIKEDKYAIVNRKNILFPKMKLKNNIWQRIVQISLRDLVSVYFYDQRIIRLDNSNDIFTIITLLHEFIHMDNIILIKDENGQILNDCYTILSELPSIAMEFEFIDWLRDKKIITDIDYKYVLNRRLVSSYNNALCSKLVSIIIDLFIINKRVSISLINDYLKSIDNRKVKKELNDMVSMLTYYLEDDSRLIINMSYVISTILSPTILRRINQDRDYRNKLIQVNDNLNQFDFEEALKILDLDYRDQEILEEIKDNLINYYNEYNEIEILELNAKIKRR